MAQIISDLIFLDLVAVFICFIFIIAGTVEKVLEVKEKRQIKKMYRRKLNNEFRQVMNEIGESINDCYEEVVDDE